MKPEESLVKDEIFQDYLQRLRDDNDRLRIEIKKKPTPIIDFSNIKGIWDDLYRSEGWSVFTAIMILGITVAGSLITWDAVTPDKPADPPKILSGNFYVRGDSYNGCYKVVQEYSAGDYMDSSPCIKDMDEAVRLRDKLDKAFRESHEHQDIRSLPATNQEPK